MKYDTVIFVYPHIVTTRDYHRFGLEFLEGRGYNVSVLTVWAKDALRDFEYSAGNYEGDNYECIEVEQFEKYVKKHKKVVYIFIGGIREEHISAIRAMNRTNSKYIITGNHGLIPRVSRDNDAQTITNNNQNSQKSTRKLYMLYKSAKRCYKNIKKSFKSKSRNMIEKPILITATCPSKVGVPDNLIDNNLVCIHARDYDRYIENEREGITPSEECIVFIEPGLAGQDQDYTIAGFQGIQGADKWEKQLESVFNKLEEYYNIPVIIAGHPHSHYFSDEYCGRKILLNQTEKLIPHAKFVIMQMSTSLNQVLIYNKEILILYNNDFKLLEKGSWYQDWLAPTCDFLGLKSCNMDDKDMFERPYEYVTKISEEKRKMYMKTYVKMDGTPEKLIIEVIEEAIRGLL